MDLLNTWLKLWGGLQKLDFPFRVSFGACYRAGIKF